MPSMQVRIDPARGLRKGELLEQSITCYCDIPFNDLQIHSAKYGWFGIGLNRDTLSAYGARPVSYVPVVTSWPAGSAGGFLLRDLSALLRGVDRHLFHESVAEVIEHTVGAEPKTKSETIDRLVSALTKDLLAFLKFYDADLPIDHLEYFYAEREWRKFGAMALGSAVTELVAPSNYVELLGRRYPQYKSKIRSLDPPE